MMNFATIGPAVKHTTPVPPENVQISIILLVILIGGIVFLIYMLRKFMRSQQAGATEDWTSANADIENPAAFMTASMQGVIEKLRAQEKELARLHLLAQEIGRAHV